MKRNKIIFWTATIFLFLFEGIMPSTALLFAPSSATAGTIYLQYPEYFAYVIIAFKVTGSILLLIPGLPRPIKEWTYAGFGFNFICATISHVVVDGPGILSFFPLVILGIAIVSYVTYFKVYGHDRILIKQYMTALQTH
ncbi:MAG: DoxX family protein [Chryseolinea sp.]